jgi:hypothetical protein
MESGVLEESAVRGCAQKHLLLEPHHSQGDIRQKKQCNFYIYIGEYKEVLNIIAMLLGHKLLIKQ